MRVETIGDATLYLGDCREILPTLGKVDAVVTDPPYGTKVTSWDESIEPAAVRAICDAATGYAVFFYSNTRLAHILNAVRDAGRDAWVAVWHKSNAMGFERRFAPQWVPIVIAYKGNPTFWGRDYIECPVTVQDVSHPTPKPVGATAWCVQGAAKNYGETVLDPFMGSGTTGIACAQLRRRFVGIEREPAYFDEACRRIEEAYRQPRLFDEPPPKPQQQSLLGDAA